MLEEVKKVLAGIRKDTEKVIRRLTENHLRCERYDVTTAPNGTVIGVTQPFGTEELLIPYSWMCSNAQVGDTVIIVWWSGLSNAQAWFMGDGWVSRLLSITSGGGGITVNGTLSTTGNATIGGNLSVLGNAIGRVLGLGQARASIPANADLNDYTEPGVYGITANTTAASLSNSPTTSAGVLRVWNALGDNKNYGSPWHAITQEYCDHAGGTWRRQGESGSDPSIIWGAWGWEMLSSAKAENVTVNVTDYGTLRFQATATHYNLGQVGVLYLEPSPAILAGKTFSTLLTIENLPFYPIGATGFVRSLSNNADGLGVWQMSYGLKKIYLRKIGGGNLTGTFDSVSPMLQVLVIGTT